MDEFGKASLSAIEGIDGHTAKAARLALQVSTPELGDQAGVVGAALLARAA